MKQALTMLKIGTKYLQTKGKVSLSVSALPHISTLQQYVLYFLPRKLNFTHNLQ